MNTWTSDDPYAWIDDTEPSDIAEPARLASIDLDVLLDEAYTALESWDQAEMHEVAAQVPALVARVRFLEADRANEIAAHLNILAEFEPRPHVLAELRGQVAQLEARVRELEAELSAQSETVQREWLSPIEKEGQKRRIEELEALLRQRQWDVEPLSVVSGIHSIRPRPRLPLVGGDGGEGNLTACHKARFA